MADIITFRWLGVAGFTLQIQSYTLAVDPFFSRPRLRYVLGGRPQAQTGLAEQYLPECQAILVTHAHHDHLMDAPGIARRTGAQLYGSPNSCQIAQVLGLAAPQTRVVQAGDKLQLGPVAVDVYAGVHPWLPLYGPGKVKPDLQAPLRLVEYRMDTDLNYHFQLDGLSVLDWGGKLDGPAPRAEVLVCGAGRNERRLEEFLGHVQPRLVIPVHWDNLFQPLAHGVHPMPGARILGRDAESFARRVRAVDPGIEVWIPEAFRTVNLNDWTGAGNLKY